MKKHLLSSMIYVTVFVTICVAMTMTSSDTNEFEDSQLDISITDLDNSEASRALAEYIGSSHDIVEIEDDKDKILDALYYRRADIILTINEGYSEKLSAGETEGLFSDYRVPGSYSTQFFDSQLNQYISMISAYTAGGMDITEAVAKAAELSANEIEVETLDFSVSNADFDSVIGMFFQYLAYILIIVLISGLCPTLLVMTKSDIRNRMNCSSLSLTSQMTQLIAGTLIVVAALYIILMTVAAVLFKSMLFNEKGLLAMLNGFVYLIFAMLLAFLLSVIAPGKNAINVIAQVISLGMSFLCGVFVPQELLSGTVLSIGKFLPAYWYVRANNMISGTGGETFVMSEYLVCIGIELAFSAAMFCVVLLIAKTKRRAVSVN